MARTAAFFDLDRTLLAGGSGPVFAATLERLGVQTPRIPGQDLLFKVFDLIGESFVVMQLARQAATRAKGLDRAMVQASAEVAADSLLERLQPYARQLFDEHREVGDLLVLATTSPYDLVAPFARRLGFDAVVATRYAEQEGIYTGSIDGRFVWGPGKLAAIRDWADANDVDVSTSAAYSDSVFDAPMLGAVARPVCVNPDYRLRALALVRRWPIRNLDVPVGVPAINGVEPFDVVRTLARPELFPGVDFSFEGVEFVPRTGPAIIAANHRSYFDPLAIGFAIAKAGRNGRFMGKKEVFDAPVVGQFARAMGAIRVDRGSGSDEPLRQAAVALAAGEVVVILPQGTIPRGEQFFDPVLIGKTGVARLAAMVPQAPVIPLGLWGTEEVWPRSSKVPNLLQISNPPVVSLRFGEAVSLRRSLEADDVRADTDLVMDAIMGVLPPESRIRREVSDEELAKTTPDGVVVRTGKASTKKPKSADAKTRSSRAGRVAAADAAAVDKKKSKRKTKDKQEKKQKNVAASENAEPPGKVSATKHVAKQAVAKKAAAKAAVAKPVGAKKKASAKKTPKDPAKTQGKTRATKMAAVGSRSSGSVLAPSERLGLKKPRG